MLLTVSCTVPKVRLNLHCKERKAEANFTILHRVDSLMEKERMFRERFVQYKTSGASARKAKRQIGSALFESKRESASDLENRVPSFST